MAEKLFITGKLAFSSLQKKLRQINFEEKYSILKIPITVAALLDSSFIIRQLKESHLLKNYTEDKLIVYLPGRSRAEEDKIETEINKIFDYQVEVVRGPDEIIDLPEFFGEKPAAVDFEKKERKIKIIAEINEAALTSLPEIITKAEYYHRSGADIVDLGCVNGREFPHLEKTIYELKKRGFKLSLDSLNAEEIKRADRENIDYVLSINSSNYSAVEGAGFIPVIIPDPEVGLNSLYKNIEEVKKRGCRNYIADPILDPINFGFKKSLSRYIEYCTDSSRNSAVMMGVGNLIELTDADSTGLNFISAGLAAELGIDYVLTTEASAKTSGSVKELDLALKINEYAKEENMLPNKLSELLITLKDRKNKNYSSKEIEEIRASVRDTNYRILSDGKEIHIFNGKEYYHGQDIKELFDRLNYVGSLSHAFYLGKELKKAETALKLKKNYRQEDELSWGYLDHFDLE
ncbi:MULTISPECIES: DUF6513 domain-containing protein [unclassified Halanaerobium]|uniref:DUF4346 domain-containing protein n=1 Tax=unclassified Halanaerobium TaxID=2641197 RepID=UPI000DF4B297|nr:MULTISPECIES: DUF6513 domain-containing protein [unclassified Halanaerobium]RCW48751.1 dihydropteroate synthase-like protein [Halanaerobium sp. MA284_MarDTE_T2]RCW89093.1 dihydropteroate synthase-like protein [Halanaerobium sp. DL-01]